MEQLDAVLVEQCLAGNAEAYRELIERHQDAVFSFCMRITGNWHEAADVAQETFIRAYRKLHFFDPRYSFRNWLFSIAANLTKNRFRSFFRRHRAEDQLRAGLTPAADTDPRLDELETALTKIPEKLRAPLLLKHVEGYSYDEIARTLGISISAAKMRVMRARDELVQLLDPQPCHESKPKQPHPQRA